MAKSDFIFVGTPHDPRSISGSDPFNPVGDARLAVWYNCDYGNVVAHSWTNNAHSRTDYTTKVLTVKDISGNSRLLSGQQRHLHPYDGFGPVLTASLLSDLTEVKITRNLLSIDKDTSDNQRFLMQSNNVRDHREWGLGTVKRYTNRADTTYSHLTDELDSLGWVTGSLDPTRAADQANYQLSGGYTIFTTARSMSNTADNEHSSWLCAAYPARYGYSHSNYPDGTGEAHMMGQFKIWQLNGDADAGGDNDKGRFACHWRDDLTEGTSTSTHASHFFNRNAGVFSQHNYSVRKFHPVSMRYDAPKTDSATRRALSNNTDWQVQLHVNGEKTSETSDSKHTGDYPRSMRAQFNGFSIGATTGTDGSYYHGVSHNSEGDEMGADGDDRESPSWTESCAFDDCLSDIRYQQIQRYFADRLQTPMSGSGGSTTLEYLSTFTGGPEGTALVGSSIANALTNGEGGTYQRDYHQAVTSSDATLIQHEVAAGAFVRSTKGLSPDKDSGAWDNSPFYNVTSSTAISMRMWVRVDGINTDALNLTADTNPRYDGSQTCLVAKASSPFGHKMDHIKGYALKFGTFKDGTKVSGGDAIVPKFRLSLRNSDQYEDGTTSESCGDIDLQHGSVTEARGEWYKMRLDVIPSGQAYDIIKCYVANRGAASTWIALGDGSATQWKVYNSDPNYRHWSDDTSFKRRVPCARGIHNGYWISMSSSDGRTLDHTKHYIDGFEILTDDV